MELISKYGNLDTLFEFIDEIKGKRKEKLENEKENAFLSRELATVHMDLDVEYNKEKLKYEEKNMD